MELKKTVVFSIISLFFLALFSSTAFCGASQRINIPYVSINSANGYWAGLSIHNEGDSDRTFNLHLYDSTGALVRSASCWDISAGGFKMDLLENWFTGKPAVTDGRYVLYIEVNGDTTDRFSATLVMGCTGDSNPGFAFESFRSENFNQTSIVLCL
jgi:hypothetical protein